VSKFLKPQASSLKPQASSLKPQASSLKPQFHAKLLKSVRFQRHNSQISRVTKILLLNAEGFYEQLALQTLKNCCLV
jgi:hypothetical protein